jgi:hypothetical protein
MPLKLNIGCGPRPFHPQHDNYTGSGWTLVDKYIRDCGIENWDAEDLPYKNVDEIYSSHLLEHIPHVKVRNVLSHWYEILGEGGKLTLNVPDLEWVFKEIRKYEQGVPLDGYYNQFDGEHGLLSIIYGTESHNGEYHKGGFTKTYVEELLSSVGFKEITVSQTIDGHDMGVLFVECLK